MLLEKRIPFKYIAAKVKYDVGIVMVIASIVYFITHTYKEILPQVPITIPAFMGTAISILLSFKLNQSYDRWWEARKIWGSIVNDSRSLVVQLQTLVAKGNENIIKQIAYRQIAWCYALGRSLRGENPLVGLDGLISDNEIENLKRHTNKPLGLIQKHGADIAQLKQKGQLELFSQIQLDDTLVRMCASMGKAERIKSTVFPVTYSIFLHLTIYLFIIILSISLTELPVHFEIPLLLVIAVAFFLLEKSATHMQNPFANKPTDTAMTAIATTIEINIKQLLGEEKVPEPYKTDDFYLL